MRLGLIARADSGGLGHLTWEFARALEPDAILVVRMGPLLARGHESVNRYGETPMVVPYEHRDLPGPWQWIASTSDVIYTAETTYGTTLTHACARHGTKIVVHAMPELLRSTEVGMATVWLPTWWRLQEAERALGHDVPMVPVPVPLDRFKVAGFDYSEPRLLHVAAPAMLDRGGTEMLAAALRYVSEPCTIVAVHADRLRSTGHVTVEHREPPRDYWRLYDDASALIAPRRYGGLSMVWQEAAAAGLGAIVLDREPDRQWPGVLVVPVNDSQPARMAGGIVPVQSCAPQALAVAIDRVAVDVGLRARLGHAARTWAVEHGWDRLGAGVRAAFARAA